MKTIVKTKLFFMFYNNNSYIEVDANEEIMHIIFHSTKTNVLQYNGIWPPHGEARIEECSYWIDQRPAGDSLR